MQCYNINFTFCSEHPFVQVMQKLNNLVSISSTDINCIIDNLTYPLSKRAMEDAAEFYNYFMNDVFSYVKIKTDKSIEALLSRTVYKSIGNAFYNAYIHTQPELTYIAKAIYSC